MRYSIAVATLAAAFTTFSAAAQDAAPANVAGSFAGFRVEGNVGWDNAHALGQSNDKLGFGGSAGFDGNLTSRIVVGPEVTYWRPSGNRNSNSVSGAAGGTVTQEGRDMWSGDVRVGYRVDPDLLVFGKGGFVTQAQRSYFNAPVGQVGYATRGHADGYQFGGGIQYAPHDRFSFAPANMYISAQYVYSQFDNHTRDEHAMAGVGFRFR